MRWSETGLVVSGLASIVGLLLANAIVSDWNTRRLVENERWVAHTRQVLQALNQVLATVSEAEAGQRGFLISGTPHYRRAFEDATRRVEDQVRRVTALTSDNPEQEGRAVELDTLVHARLASLRHTASVRQEQGPEAAKRIVDSDEGQRIMEQIRGLVAAMTQTEDALLTERAAQSDRSLSTKVVTNFAGTAIGILAVSIAFLLFQRTLAERSRAEARARMRAAHEAAIGELRQQALSEADLDTLMDRAGQLIARGLDVPLVKVLELLPGEEDFLLRAGVGWQEGCVGRALVGAGLDSQAGYTLHASHPVVVGDLTSYEPIVVDDLRREHRFSGPKLLRDHGVVSGMSVIIHDRSDRPFGVLGAHTTRPRTFTDEDQRFLQAMANVLASAIQRRRAEDARRESEARFRALADTVPGFVWTSLPDGACDYVNQRWRDATGMTLEETRGLGWTAALHPEDLERSLDRWMKSMETGEPFECEYRFRMRDGSYRWCLGRALPVQDEDGRALRWFGSCTDIEDHKRMEAALVEADRQKDLFLATLGHELRNPLGPIVNALELLKRRAAHDRDLQWEVDAIDRQVLHMTRLVDDLLDASRIGRGKIRLERTVVEIADVVSRAVEVTRPMIDARRHELAVEVPHGAIRVDGDATRLVQVVANLLTNAARYTEPSGRIWLDVAREGENAVIRVRDTGVGIAPDMLPRIFEMFLQVNETANRSPGGLGIGLALVRKLVELHGGRVEARSEGPGRGSEFRVHLPVLPAERAVPEAPAEVERPQPALRPCRVLVVDDNDLLAESFARLLRRDGCEARTARDGASALRAARELRPEAVFLDVGLPDMDGYEVARRLRADPAFEKTLLVAVTGYGQEEAARQARRAGFDQHLIKPVRFDAVERLLREFQAREA